MNSLYNIGSALRALLATIEENEGEVTTEIEEALKINQAELETKGVNYALAIRELTGRIGTIDAEIKRLQDIKKKANALADRLEHNISTSMQEFGVEKIEGDLITLSLRKSKKVVITDEAAIPAEYMRIVPETREPDKTLIKKAIEGGTEIPGALIEPGKNLQIK